MGRKDTRSRRLWTSGLCALVLAGGMAGIAQGQTYVIDTGPGAAQGGLSLTRNQYLAGQFTLDLGHEINGLEGWMIYPTLIGELPVYVVLYGDDGGVPDLGNQLHSQLIQVPASGIPFAANWHGISGLEIPVYGGIPYWLAFEVPTEDFGSGAMPPTPLQELDLYAIDSTAGYSSNTTARIGIRVLPEPGLGTMLACGIAALASASGSSKVRRRRARS